MCLAIPMSPPIPFLLYIGGIDGQIVAGDVHARNIPESVVTVPAMSGRRRGR